MESLLKLMLPEGDERTPHEIMDHWARKLPRDTKDPLADLRVPVDLGKQFDDRTVNCLLGVWKHHVQPREPTRKRKRLDEDEKRDAAGTVLLCWSWC